MSFTNVIIKKYDPNAKIIIGRAENATDSIVAATNKEGPNTQIAFSNWMEPCEKDLLTFLTKEIKTHTYISE